MSFFWAPFAVAVFKAALKAAALPGEEVLGAGLESGLNLTESHVGRSERKTAELTKAITKRQIKQLQQFDEFERSCSADEKLVAIEAVQKVIGTQQITFEALERSEFDPFVLVNLWWPRLQGDFVARGISESATEYGRRLYELVVRQQVAIVRSTPQVHDRLAFESYLLLKQTQLRFVESLDQIILPQGRSGSTEEQSRFLATVLQDITNRHGRTELFGLDDVPAALRWAPLDATYVSLSASFPVGPRALRDRPGSPSGAPGSFRGARQSVEHTLSGLLAHAHTDSKGLRLAISGTAGSGKTTIAKWVAARIAMSHQNPHVLPVELARLSRRVPLYVPLRSTIVDDSAPIPVDALLRTVVRGGSAPGGWLEGVLQKGTAVLIFDGLDELPEPRKKHAQEWIEHIAKAHDRVDIILTMRPEAFHGPFLASLGFTAVSLKPLDIDQIFKVVTQWFDAQCLAVSPLTAESYRDRQQSLLSRLTRDSAFQELAETPLLAAMLCAYYASSSGEGPLHQRKLINGVIAALLDGRERSRGLVPAGLEAVYLEHKVNLLGQLALSMFQRGVSNFGVSPAARGAATFALTADGKDALPVSHGLSVPVSAVFDHMLQRSGLILRVSEFEGVFVHRIFLEFLAAHRLVQMGSRNILEQSRELPGWYSVTAAYCWLAAEHETLGLVHDLLNLPPSDVKEADRRLAYCLADCLSGVIDEALKLRSAVSDRLRSSLPPETEEEVAHLATLRGTALEMLKNPRNGAEAVAAVLTASRIRTTEAINLIESVVNGPYGHQCFAEVLDAWRQFPAASYAARVMRNLDLGASEIVIHNNACALAAAELTSARKFRLSRCDGLTDLQWTAALQHCEELDLRDAVDLVDVSALRSRVDLRALRLPDSGRVADLTPLSACENLESLYSDKAVASLSALRMLTRLSTLSIGGLSQDAIEEFSLHSHRLKTLIFRNCDIADASFLSKQTLLQRLVLSRVKTQATLDLGPLTNLKQLELVVSGVDSILLPQPPPPSSVMPECAASRAPDRLGLKVLRIRVEGARRGTIVRGLRNQSELIDMRLSGDVALAASSQPGGMWSTWDFSVLSECAPGLRRVEVERAARLVSLRGIDRLRLLRKLGLNECAVTALEGAVREIERVDVPDESGINASELKLLAISGQWSIGSCSRLEVVNISNCSELTDIGALIHCPRLKYVSVRGAWNNIVDPLLSARPDVEIDYDDWSLMVETG